jgi:hypothetical protein
MLNRSRASPLPSRANCTVLPSAVSTSSLRTTCSASLAFCSLVSFRDPQTGRSPHRSPQTATRRASVRTPFRHPRQCSCMPPAWTWPTRATLLPSRRTATVPSVSPTSLDLNVITNAAAAAAVAVVAPSAAWYRERRGDAPLDAQAHGRVSGSMLHKRRAPRMELRRVSLCVQPSRLLNQV